MNVEKLRFCGRLSNLMVSMKCSYAVANYSHYPHGRRETITERGLSFGGFCDFDCNLLLTITPTDLRYNGAQITGIVRLPECFKT